MFFLLLKFTVVLTFGLSLQLGRVSLSCAQVETDTILKNGGVHILSLLDQNISMKLQNSAWGMTWQIKYQHKDINSITSI